MLCKYQPAARVHLREQHMALQLNVPLQRQASQPSRYQG